MVDRCSRSEFDEARRSVAHSARRTDRELERRGAFQTVEWATFAIQHGDLVGDDLRREAEALVLAWLAPKIWSELERYVAWPRLPDCHQEACIALLEQLRSGSASIWDLRRRGIRDIAFDVAAHHVLGLGIDEGQER